MSWLKNKSIAFRVYTLAGAAIIGLVLVLVINTTFSNQANQANADAQVMSGIAADVASLEIESLQIRRSEKDFLLRLDEKYAVRYHEAADRRLQSIGDIAALSTIYAEAAEHFKAIADVAEKGRAEAVEIAVQAQATDRITAQINDMQSVTDVAVGAIKTTGETIERLSSVMVGVASAVEEQQATTNEISRSVQFTNEGTQRVASEIREVSSGAEQTGSASADVMSAAEQLEDLARGIKTEVDSFLERVQGLEQA